MSGDTSAVPIQWANLSPKVQALGKCSYCSRQAEWMKRSHRGWVALCYRHAGKTTSEDPKRVRPEDYKGRRVRLLQDIETKGGIKFPKGSVMRVNHVEGRSLSLSMRNPDPKNIFGQRRLSVRNVPTREVELVEESHG